MAHEDEPIDPGKLLDPTSNVFSLGEWHSLVTGMGLGFGAAYIGGFLVATGTVSVLTEEPAYFGAGFAMGAVLGSIVGTFVGRLI